MPEISKLETLHLSATEGLREIAVQRIHVDALALSGKDQALQIGNLLVFLPELVQHCIQHRRDSNPLHVRRWIAAVPDVTGYPPGIAGFPLVNRDVLATVLHRRASYFGMQVIVWPPSLSD